MDANLRFAQELYRIAQRAMTERFEAVALAALCAQVPFEAALWFSGPIDGGRLQVHRLHAYRVPPEALEPWVARLRQDAEALAAAAAAPRGSRVADPAEHLGAAPGAAPSEHVRRGGLEQQLLVGTEACGTPGGEWLSLHRCAGAAPFGPEECARLRVLMPHLSEARAVHRALCLAHVSGEPGIAPAAHRALTLRNGTVLHCGRQLGAALEALWPGWNGLRLPGALWARLLREDVVPLPGRGETLRARRFTDALVLSLQRVSPEERLTRREYEVARLYAAGRDYHDVARRCHLAPSTVRNLLRRSYRKLGIHSRTQLARLMRPAAQRPALEIHLPGR